MIHRELRQISFARCWFRSMLQQTLSWSKKSEFFVAASSQVFSELQLFSTLGTFLTLWIQGRGWSWERSRTWSEINFSSHSLFLPSTDFMAPRVEPGTPGAAGWEAQKLPRCYARTVQIKMLYYPYFWSLFVVLYLLCMLTQAWGFCGSQWE